MEHKDWNDISRLSYLGRLAETRIRANSKSLVHCKSKAVGSGKAWDNVKRKNGVRYMPRGRAAERLDMIEGGILFV